MTTVGAPSVRGIVGLTGLAAFLAFAVGTLVVPIAAREARLVAIGVGCVVVVLPFLRSWPRYALLLLLLFCFLALVRRIFPGPSNDPASFLPTLATLPVAVVALQRRLPTHITCYLLTTLVAFAFGLGRPLVALLGLVATAGPLLAGHHLGQRLSPRQERRIVHSLSVVLVLVSSYGVYQFYRIPGFDRSWQIRTNFLSANLPGTADFRPWSTLPSPGTAAAFAALALLAVLAQREKGLWRTLQWSSVTVTVAFLALTKVRVAWLMALVALVYLVLVGVVRLRPLLLALCLGSVVLFTFAGTMAVAGVADRGTTFGGLQSDGSAQARLGLFATAKEAVLSVPEGLGAQSLGSRTEANSRNLDNGYVANIVEGGPIALLGVLVLFIGQARVSTPRGRVLILALALLHGGVGALAGITVFLSFLLSGSRGRGSGPARQKMSKAQGDPVAAI